MNFNERKNFFLSTEHFPIDAHSSNDPAIACIYIVQLFPLVRYPSLLALETDGWPRDDNFEYHTNTHRMWTVQCLLRLLHFFPSTILIIIYTYLRRMEIDVDVARMFVHAYYDLLFIPIAMASTRWCNHDTLAFLLHTNACTPANLRCDDGWQPLSTSYQII